MLKLDSMAGFAAVAETGSITAAARRLGLSKSVISERLSEIERQLGTKLVDRTTRRLLLTRDGDAFYRRAQEILRDVDAAAAELTQRRGILAGPLRISAPVSFGYLHLGPALFGFLAKHPQIELTLELEDRFVDMQTEGFDAVLRHGPVEDKRIIVKRFAASRRALVASPGYFKRHGRPTSLQDLAEHRGILYGNRGATDWRFREGRRCVSVRPRTALRVNNGLVMRDAAIAGIGIALLPGFLSHAAVKAQSLKIVDVGAEAEGAALYIGYPQHARSSAKIRALTQWLQTNFGNPVYWD